MNYSKPEVVVSTNAAVAVKGNTKGVVSQIDSSSGKRTLSSGAYESDE